VSEFDLYKAQKDEIVARQINLSEDEIRADERRKVAEEIAVLVEEENVAVCGGLYNREDDGIKTLFNAAKAIRARYLQNKPAPEVKHVCGAAGYRQSIYDRCPACEASEVKP
jgi:hypothetical protein